MNPLIQQMLAMGMQPDQVMKAVPMMYGPSSGGADLTQVLAQQPAPPYERAIDATAAHLRRQHEALVAAQPGGSYGPADAVSGAAPLQLSPATDPAAKQKMFNVGRAEHNTAARERDYQALVAKYSL